MDLALAAEHYAQQAAVMAQYYANAAALQQQQQQPQMINPAGMAAMAGVGFMPAAAAPGMVDPRFLAQPAMAPASIASQQPVQAPPLPSGGDGAQKRPERC